MLRSLSLQCSSCWYQTWVYLHTKYDFPITQKWWWVGTTWEAWDWSVGMNPDESFLEIWLVPLRKKVLWFVAVDNGRHLMVNNNITVVMVWWMYNEQLLAPVIYETDDMTISRPLIGQLFEILVSDWTIQVLSCCLDIKVCRSVNSGCETLTNHQFQTEKWFDIPGRRLSWIRHMFTPSLVVSTYKITAGS